MRGSGWLAAAALLAAGAAHARYEGDPTDGGWRLVVLGVAQDAGRPHLGCNREHCAAIREGRAEPQKVSCLGLVHRERGEAYLFDATPDLPAQVHALTGGRLPDGIFLTHAHIGHYTGLVYLGKESAAARGVPVYATRRMGELLSRNAPWSLLVGDGHVALRRLEPDRPVSLPGGVAVTPLLVPHRDELSDTVGFRIDGPRRSALFIPDVDRWDRWDRDLRTLADEVDLVFLDGTFASAEELPHRDIWEIPHPLMSDTRARLKGAAAALWFIHLNHTNGDWDASDVAREGMDFPL